MHTYGQPRPAGYTAGMFEIAAGVVLGGVALMLLPFVLIAALWVISLPFALLGQKIQEAERFDQQREAQEQAQPLD